MYFKGRNHHYMHTDSGTVQLPARGPTMAYPMFRIPPLLHRSSDFPFTAPSTAMRQQNVNPSGCSTPWHVGNTNLPGNSSCNRIGEPLGICVCNMNICSFQNDGLFSGQEHKHLGNSSCNRSN